MAATCIPSNTSATFFFPISEFLSIVFYQRIICTKARSFQKSLSKSFWSTSFLQQRHVELSEPKKLTTQSSFFSSLDDFVSLRREEVEMVIGNLGLCCGGGGDGGFAVYGRDELMKMFEERGPSIEEVEEAFDIFDGNKDGYIEADDLQRVLGGLGFHEGGEVADCKKMIAVYDEDGDGKIDFQEFVKLMESSCSC